MFSIHSLNLVLDISVAVLTCRLSCFHYCCDLNLNFLSVWYRNWLDEVLSNPDSEPWCLNSLVKHTWPRISCSLTLNAAFSRRDEELFVRGLTDFTSPICPIWSLPSCIHRPCQPPRAISPCPNDAAAGQVCSAPQLCPGLGHPGSQGSCVRSLRLELLMVPQHPASGCGSPSCQTLPSCSGALHTTGSCWPLLHPASSFQSHFQLDFLSKMWNAIWYFFLPERST